MCRLSSDEKPINAKIGEVQAVKQTFMVAPENKSAGESLEISSFKLKSQGLSYSITPTFNHKVGKQSLFVGKFR